MPPVKLQDGQLSLRKLWTAGNRISAVAGSDFPGNLLICLSLRSLGSDPSPAISSTQLEQRGHARKRAFSLGEPCLKQRNPLSGRCTSAVASGLKFRAQGQSDEKSVDLKGSGRHISRKIRIWYEVLLLEYRCDDGKIWLPAEQRQLPSFRYWYQNLWLAEIPQLPSLMIFRWLMS